MVQDLAVVNEDAGDMLVRYCSPRGLFPVMIKDYCDGDFKDDIQNWNGAVSCRLPGMESALDFFSTGGAVQVESSWPMA
jgi:hypothetical protein